jgi:hypothetical protein
MVNTGTPTPSTPLKSDTPDISISLSTFTNTDLVSLGQSSITGGRFCSFEISVSGVKLSLANNTFERIFNYVINLANNDINPIPGLNTATIPNVPNAIGTTPKGLCNVQVDKKEIIPVVSLVLSSQNIRLDYMDEFFQRTLAYLQLAITEDLNPDD